MCSVTSVSYTHLESGKLGFIGGMELDTTKGKIAGFEAAAKYVGEQEGKTVELEVYKRQELLHAVIGELAVGIAPLTIVLVEAAVQIPADDLITVQGCKKISSYRCN